ncbi:MAG: SPOR domain-containing protein [Gammaproteobacteria bacterium]|nr:SPOR domain-containing protein [Gammaproteobacteria bacterium]MBU6509564.1 SPOR domain-containing protein [Gammaproteobacteria bacterium]MDE1983421.1 SPOR domain-containing protein [Gammaproteobacteria bacterium]MDE2107932.1 SPOR domain-containing protein [Gammaproteobacteria bacterium]MDE2460407.1 SPOR domain-containing protein [Gammaproteobacteria bacterium]
MQIGLKERLIGAVVLVILAIIIIPWVLKGGSAPDTTVTQKLALPQATTAPTAQTTYHMALNGPTGSSIVPAAGAAVQTAPEVSSAQTAAPVPPPLAAKPSRQVTAPPRAAPAPATGKWAVQAGSYGNERNALAIEHQLVKHGLHAYISRYRKSGRNYYRVRVGPYPERAAAERAVKEVQRAAGGRAEVVPES